MLLLYHIRLSYDLIDYKYDLKSELKPTSSHSIVDKAWNILEYYLDTHGTTLNRYNNVIANVLLSNGKQLPEWLVRSYKVIRSYVDPSLLSLYLLPLSLPLPLPYSSSSPLSLSLSPSPSPSLSISTSTFKSPPPPSLSPSYPLSLSSSTY